MSTLALVNGEPDAHPLISNRGLAYGDGLFETIAFVAGELRYWQAHLNRLFEGCRRLSITPPEPAQLLNEVQQLLAERRDAIVKIILTRGAGGRGYAPTVAVQSVRIVQVFDPLKIPSEWRTHGLTAGLCETRLGNNPTLAGMKHLNRLEQVLAARECTLNGWDEGLMFNANDELISGTKTNVFVAFDSHVVTPSLDACGVHGVMRRQVLDVARDAGMEILESNIHRDRLADARAIFLTNALLGPISIGTLQDNSALGIANDFKDFAICSKIQNLINR